MKIIQKGLENLGLFRNFLIRSLTALFIGALFLLVLYKGGLLLYYFVLLVEFFAFYEYIKNLKIESIYKTFFILYGFLILFALFIIFRRFQFYYFPLIFLVSLFPLPFLYQKGFNLNFYLRIFYLPFYLSFGNFLFYLRDFYKFSVVLFLFINIWVYDTFAYVFGSLLGKHKLALRVSPGKTVEGFLFGFVGSFLVAFIFFKLKVLNKSFLILVIVSLIIGLISQVGDLFESVLKRDLGIKDFSSILPGHGGILDRIDSILFAMPVFYYLWRYLAR
ncbi:hypothetical protein DRN73_07555 [Candidatus Pacearchaeota archaeon]|nr:MAG: hypothetical protein DRN73_07555 [Candidatus Pacearchaeota archaeon]